MPRAERAVRLLIERANKDLKQHSIKVHLSLHSVENDYILDIYDCSDNLVCNVVADAIIPLKDIPMLIRHLQEEAGILIDTTS